MTQRQKIFCDEYLKDLNATRAYMVAYPNVKNEASAGAASCRLLKNVKIRQYIDAELEKMHNERVADAQEVIEYLSAVMRGKTLAETVVIEVQADSCTKARRMEKAPEEKERLKAAELLGKYHVLFTDKTQIEGEGVVQIINDIPRVDTKDDAK